MRVGSGTAVAAGALAGTGGGSVAGFGPDAVQLPKAFSTTSRARSGATFPTTAMVVRSGRKTRR